MRLRPHVHATEMTDIFDTIRADEELPMGFSPAVMEAARRAAPVLAHEDLRHIEFATIDPPGSMDLDQAMAFTPLGGGGARLLYAIADVGAFVSPGDPIDIAARARGTTVYCPDRRIPLHPVPLSEGAASLLPDRERPAVVFEIDIDDRGDVLRSDVRRAIVRSRQRFDYATVQRRFDAGDPPGPVALLEWFGELRMARGIERGALSLRLPDQEAVQFQGRWQLVNRGELAVERWNAEVSLLTGMVAATMMIDAGAGILRTLPRAGDDALGQLRGAARALGIDWSRDDTAAGILAGLDPSRPHDLALFEEASRLLQGAGYIAFSQGLPAGDTEHAGVAAHYTHVTAPLRRLVDRFSLAACLAISAGESLPDWALGALEDLPGLMAATAGRAGRVENRCIDAVEAWVLRERMGETLEAVVLSTRGGGADVWIEEPPILTRLDGLRERPGSVIRAVVTAADPARGAISLEKVA